MIGLRLEELRVEGTPETVRGEDVYARVPHERRRSGHRVEHALHARPDPLPPPPTSSVSRQLGRTGQIEEVGPLGVVQLKSAGERLEHPLRDPVQVAALQAGVVVGTDPGEERDFLPPEPRTRRSPYAVTPAWSGVSFARREVRNSRASLFASTRSA